MILNVAQIIANKLEENGSFKEDKEIYKYGIAMMISYSIGASAIILIGIFTKQVIHSLIYLLLFDKLRSDTGGFHANTYIQCNTLFILSFIFHLMFILNLTYQLLFIFAMISLGVIYPSIPIEHPNKKLSRKDRIVSRKKSLTKFVLGIVVAIVFNTSCLIGNAIYSVIIIVAFFGVLQIISNKRREENGNII